MSASTPLGPYDVLAPLTRGGMAELFLARRRDDASGPAVVVKRLLPEVARETAFLDMFADEVRLARALSHPNIVKSLDDGNDGGHPFLVMEYLNGEDLRGVVRAFSAQGRRMPLPMAVHVIRELCRGLEHAHSLRDSRGVPLGIIHRDLSPHNVFVTFEGEVKLIDFGIAKSREQSHETRAGTVKGKLAYMSPEQLRGQRLDRRADLYAVGILLYYLTVGKRPHTPDRPGEFALMTAVAQHIIAAPSSVIADYPRDLEAIVLRAMAADARGRFSTAQELDDALGAFVETHRATCTSREVRLALRELFALRVAAWEEAQGESARLAAEAAQAVGDRGAAEDEDSQDEAAFSRVIDPALEAAALRAGTVVEDIFCHDGHTVIRLRGVLDEQFRGADLGAAFNGIVVLDLEELERITSFGVREWLAMMKAVPEGTRLYLARCPDVVVTQLGTIRSFAGRARVLSFVAPYRCDRCRLSFGVLLDVHEHGAQLLAGEAPRVPCGACGAAAIFDDDPRILSFAVDHLGAEGERATDEAVLAVLATYDRRPGRPVVEKRVTAEGMRLLVTGAVPEGFRWDRLLDGVDDDEDALLEVARGASVSPASARTFVSALPPTRRAPLVVRGATWSMFAAHEELRAARGSEPAGLSIQTVRLAAPCSPCGGVREVLLTLTQARTGRGAVCPRCGAPLPLPALATNTRPVASVAAATSPIATPPPIAPPVPLAAPTGPAPAPEASTVVAPTSAPHEPANAAGGLDTRRTLFIVGLAVVVGLVAGLGARGCGKTVEHGKAVSRLVVPSVV